MSDLPFINSSVRDVGRKMARFHPDDIDIGPRLRNVREDDVERIARSMADIGLRTPISVRHFTERPSFLAGADTGGDALLLLTGAHRLAAAKKLGWEQIECIVYFEGDEIDAQLWEIAENLHRAELTKAQRDEHIRRYAELLAERERKPTQIASVLEKGGRGKVSVASKIAAETGLSKDTVRRALNPQRAEAEKEKRKTQQQDGQIEHERQRQSIIDQLPPETQMHIAAQQESRSFHDADDIEELRNIIAAQQEEIADLRSTVAKYDDMVVEYERGGFENIIAGLNQRIENLQRQVERESQEKVKNLRSAAYWKKKAMEAGANADVAIDMETGEISRG